MNALAIAIGSAAGGVARWLLGGAVQRKFGWAAARVGPLPFPIGTLVVNVSGSMLLGALAVLVARRPEHGAMLRLLLMIGFCGGYTTMSSFSLETVTLAEQGAMGSAAAYVLATLVLAFAGTACGIALARMALQAAGS